MLLSRGMIGAGVPGLVREAKTQVDAELRRGEEIER
jgi:hypothetical protein